MGLFKGIFGSRDKGDSSPRSLNHPVNLQKGDIIKFGFTAQNGISNQSFSVEDINTYDFGGENQKKFAFTIKGVSNNFRMAVIEDTMGQRLEIGLSVLPDDVKKVFNENDFINLLDPDTGVNHVLERTGEPDFLLGWTASVYRQEAGHNAYYHAGDYRDRLLPTTEMEGSAFSYYLLVNDNREFAIEVQVFDGGRTGVYILCYLPISKIEEMWPSGK